ncbi:MAG: alpha/beta fold hydrolase [Myxococcota bacterium]
MRVSTSLYPFEGRHFNLGGLRYHYLDEGKGEPVVMLHGNPTWSFYYRDLVRGLRDRYRIIVPDHIGCGLSDKPDDTRYEYSLERRVDDLDALLDDLGLDQKLTLVMHDWGGMIGMSWAVRHPDRIRRLVLLNTAAFHLPKAKKLPTALWWVRNTSFAAFMVRRFNAFSRGAAWVCCTRRRLSKEVRDAYCAPYDSWENRIATLRFVQDIPLRAGDRGYDLISEVESKLGSFADTPVLICWGEKDFVFDHHFLDVWQQHLPDAEVHRFPDCGHYVLEDASDEILALVERFLADPPSE